MNYYQIDYVDNEGFATYVDTFIDREEAIEKVNYLNHINKCLNRDTKFVLDRYDYEYNEYGEACNDSLIEENITNSITILERVDKVKSRYYNKDKQRSIL